MHDAVFERNKNVEERFDVIFDISVDRYDNVNDMYDGVGSYVKDLLTNGSKDISSAMKTYQKSAKRKIENIVKAFDGSLQQN